MKKNFFLLVLLNCTLVVSAADYTLRNMTESAVGSGMYLANNADNWEGGVLPTLTATDNVTVPLGVTIVWNIASGSSVINKLTVHGTLCFFAPIILTGTWTSGSTSVTVSSTTGLAVGMKVMTGTNSGSGIVAAQTITAITPPSSITISANATATSSTGIGTIGFINSAGAFSTTSFITVNELTGNATGVINTTAQGANIRFTTDAAYSFAGLTRGNCMGFVATATDVVGGSIKLLNNATMNNISFNNGNAATAFPTTTTTISTSGVLTLAAANSAVKVGTMIYTAISGAPSYGMFVTAVNSPTSFQLNFSPSSIITAGSSNMHYTNNYIDLNGNQLTVTGNIHGNTTSPTVSNVNGAGFFKGNSSSSLIISTGVHTVTNYSVNLAPETYNNITINTAMPIRPAGTGSAITINNLNIGANVNIATNTGFTLGTGSMVVAAGGRFSVPAATTVNFNNRPVTLQASSTANGYISNLGTISNATDVTIQQWVTGQRGYRVLSNPFSTTLSPTTISSSNGITITGANDVKTYNNADNTWSGNITTIAANQAYAAFIRGLASEVTGLTYSAGPTAFAYGVKGTLNGTTVNITPNATGFTLVGNPHPGPVNSQTLTGGVASTSYYVYNVTQGFTNTQVKSGGWTTALTSGTTTPVPVMGVIGYEAGTATPFDITTAGLNFSNTPTTNLFSNESSIKNLALQLQKDGNFHDNLFIKEDASATDVGTDKVDLKKFKNDISNIYTIASDKTYLGVDARSKINTTIPLGITAEIGKYTISINENTLSNGKNLYLFDKLLNTKTLLERGATYSFDITSNADSKGDARFEITSSMVGAQSEVILNESFAVKVLGNIVNNSVNVKIEGAKGPAYITVTDMQGKIISTQTSSNTFNKLNITGASGMYFIQVNDGVNSAISKIVKQ
jgi:hypothetical protein